MKYFDEDFLAFFKELEKNNSKSWFDLNRKRYEKSVKIPFKKFVSDLVYDLQVLYPDKNLQENHSIMRINRDTRFSQDKTPYKIQMSSIILPNGKKDKSKPGFYIQANHKDVRVYSGCHGLDKTQLQSIREQINVHLTEFNDLISSKDFVDLYGQILGEKHQRIPKEYTEVAQKQPLIKNKEFYWYFKISPEELLKDDLIALLISKYKKALPLNRFFENALN
ncbi:DUF2461 domain-containing protein [Flagellimonas hymeniacidonis]|uniref:DUF2461 domain-containing protein n=1 Tax=Flagellimonas hymeniacidonis TaxID=2603628 RepID=A0A5C8V865_9FLAO|nr:DUF2461 domain-containing protein [Flagellimonas hymeniacidonis]TXN38304.1 DUF2461 domain-containing protein [Flagellimonas hymeniacidonis]